MPCRPHLLWAETRLSASYRSSLRRVGARAPRFAQGTRARRPRRPPDGVLGPGAGPVLDLACGTGTHARVLADLGWAPFGLDLSMAQLRYACGRMPVIAAGVGAWSARRSQRAASSGCDRASPRSPPPCWTPCRTAAIVLIAARDSVDRLTESELLRHVRPRHPLLPRRAAGPDGRRDRDRERCRDPDEPIRHRPSSSRQPTTNRSSSPYPAASRSASVMAVIAWFRVNSRPGWHETIHAP